MLEICFKCAPKMLQKCSRCASKYDLGTYSFFGATKYAPKMLEICFKCAPKMLEMCFII
jgi:hypothetical protein